MYRRECATDVVARCVFLVKDDWIDVCGVILIDYFFWFMLFLLLVNVDESWVQLALFLVVPWDFVRKHRVGNL